jgi:hypothetical protein
MLLIGGYDIDKDHQINKRDTSGKKVDDVAKEITRKKSYSIPELSFGGASDINPYEAVKTKNLLNRRKTCREQIKHWSQVLWNTEMMMLVQADEMRSAQGGIQSVNEPI